MDFAFLKKVFWDTYGQRNMHDNYLFMNSITLVSASELPKMINSQFC